MMKSTIFKKFNTLMGWFSNITSTIGNAVKGAADYVGQKLSEGAQFLGQKVAPIIPVVSDVISAITDIADKAVPYLKYIPGIGNVAQDVVGSVSTGLKDINSYLKTGAGNDLERVKSMASAGSNLLL